MAPADLAELVEQEPTKLAKSLVDAARRAGRATWAADLAGALDRLAVRDDGLRRILRVWGLSDAEAGRVFGVSRQAVSKWRNAGVPGTRRVAMADVIATTDLLTHHLKADRIPAAVRRPAKAFDGLAMVDFITAGRTDELLARTRDLFDLHRLDAA
ncbi:hypothetical protein [Iamia sp.]|uniref:hypothetical protein n=1 Tax=Iamia sp. TaxID=2722710 RepID=UPI002BBDEB58|nr:hypothetical protein [Iamia sp.]HXH55933.1 hypothetical protein [Iamia sp.]